MGILTHKNIMSESDTEGGNIVSESTGCKAVFSTILNIRDPNVGSKGDDD